MKTVLLAMGLVCNMLGSSALQASISGELERLVKIIDHRMTRNNASLFGNFMGAILASHTHYLAEPSQILMYRVTDQERKLRNLFSAKKSIRNCLRVLEVAEIYKKGQEDTLIPSDRQIFFELRSGMGVDLDQNHRDLAEAIDSVNQSGTMDAYFSRYDEYNVVGVNFMDELRSILKSTVEVRTIIRKSQEILEALHDSSDSESNSFESISF